MAATAHQINQSGFVFTHHLVLCVILKNILNLKVTHLWLVTPNRWMRAIQCIDTYNSIVLTHHNGLANQNFCPFLNLEYNEHSWLQGSTWTTSQACVTLTFNLPKWNFQMAHLHIKKNNCAKLFEIHTYRISGTNKSGQTDRRTNTEVIVWQLCLAHRKQAPQTLVTTCNWPIPYLHQTLSSIHVLTHWRKKL